ncbi:hypothetical protein [Nocardia suismassiliense]|uniref:hypothetical protein n=1 Tax=Nocardia suismassiliense TaxID=2077092 RepID=UPI00131EDDB4|nr:hypothetical protein [Nocardia suismassiliense]
MTEPEDLMTAEQQALVLAVVDTQQSNPAGHRRTTRQIPRRAPRGRRRGTPHELPNVVFQPGEPPKIVLARMLDVLEAFDQGEDYTPPPADADGRY